jgi:hypothetical protein
MVLIKFTAPPRTLIISPKFLSIASDEAIELSLEQRETSTKQPEESLVGQQMVASAEVASEQAAKSDCGSQSGDSGNNETASDNSRHVKVAGAATLAGISYNFGLSTITKTRLGSLENNARYFLKWHYQPPGAESIPDPRANEAVVFKDFFTTGLCMPPHSILLDILCKFWVQLHQLMPNAIVQIGKFI